MSEPVGPRFAHRYSARIYYADTEFSGVVYYGRYLEFLERGRSDLLHAAGIRHRGRPADPRSHPSARAAAPAGRQVAA